MENKIKLPFLNEFKDRIISGQKTAITGTRIMGEPLDWFEAFGRTFIITDVLRLCLQDVAYLSYKEEGFKTPYEFIKIWKQMHPRMGYKPEKKVYHHIFKSQRELATPHLHQGNPCEICNYPIREETQDH